jgi:hypothetical protein
MPVPAHLDVRKQLVQLFIRRVDHQTNYETYFQNWIEFTLIQITKRENRNVIKTNNSLENPRAKY